MTRLDQDTIKAAWRHLEKIKIFSIGELASVLTCSIPNARLKLKLWQAYTSYNQNGKYYTLPQVPQFNQHGLWRYKDIAFSKHGNLKKTIINLVTASAAGLSGRQLGELLGLSPQSFLHHFRQCPGIYREKHDGVYIYFSDRDEVREKQVQQRSSLVQRSAIVTVSDPVAVIILVAIIRHHGISVEEILALPEIKKSKIKLSNIQGFMEYHGLLKKISDSRH
jgi:biotin operon repressor